MARVSAFERDLRAAFRHVSDANITLAVALCQGRYSDDMLDAMPAVVAMRHQCFSEPWHHHKLMVALDSLLETHGREYLGEVRSRGGPPIEYLSKALPRAITAGNGAKQDFTPKEKVTQ